jgi:hypothetical protein
MGGNLDLFNYFFHIILRADQFHGFIEFDKDVRVVNCRLRELFALQMLTGCRFQCVKSLDLWGLHGALAGFAKILYLQTN